MITPCRGCKKVATALVTWVGLVDLESRKVFTLNDVNPKPLEDFVKFSGFGCVEDWSTLTELLTAEKPKPLTFIK